MDKRLVVLLSGINVGKAKRISMADLRALVGSLGFTDVATHLQSGNVALSAPAGVTPAAVGAQVERALAERGLATVVVVRTARELAAAVAADPLAAVATDPSRHLLGFPAGAVAPGAAAAVETLDTPSHPARLVADHLYLWCPDGILASPFATVAWPKVLGTTVTMRNWNTVTKLAELSGRSET